MTSLLFNLCTGRYMPGLNPVMCFVFVLCQRYPTSCKCQPGNHSIHFQAFVNFVSEYFRQTIADGVLCKLLSMVTREESSQSHHTNAIQLQSYISDPKNYRSLQKSSSSLWDALLEIHTSHV